MFCLPPTIHFNGLFTIRSRVFTFSRFLCEFSWGIHDTRRTRPPRFSPINDDEFHWAKVKSLIVFCTGCYFASGYLAVKWMVNREFDIWKVYLSVAYRVKLKIVWFLVCSVRFPLSTKTCWASFSTVLITSFESAGTSRMSDRNLNVTGENAVENN